MTRYLKTPITDAAKAKILTSFRHVPRLSNNIICDFCGEDFPVYVYASSRLSTGEHVYCWRWCACIRCTKLVDFNEWDYLKIVIKDRLKVIRSLVVLPPQIVTYAVDKAFQEFLDFAVKEE